MKAVREMSWVEFQARVQETNLAILPIGATEVIGPHLPLGTDGFLAEIAARRVAERTNALLLPLIPVGDSDSVGFYGFPGTLSVRPETLKAYVHDVCESVIRHGVRRILFLSPHGPNAWVVDPLAAELQREHPGVRCALVNFWHLLNAIGQRGVMESGEDATNHGSELDTSAMLYLVPDFVDMSRAVVSSPKTHDRFPDVHQYPDFRDVSDSGVIGNPTVASAEKGKRLVEAGIDRVVEFVTTAF